MALMMNITAVQMSLSAAGGDFTKTSAELTPIQPTEVLIKQQYAGVNFIDIYQQQGLYPLPLPTTLGLEAQGIAMECGAAVTTIQNGDQVAYAVGPLGAYASHRILDAGQLIVVPDSLVDLPIAGTLLRGLTVEYLTERLFPVQQHQVVLLHAAAGILGQIACQWLKKVCHATVIATCSTAKKHIVEQFGVDAIIGYDQGDFVQQVRDFTHGRGVDVVYDSVGLTTFEQSLDCLATRGVMVSFGNASGPVPPISPLELGSKGGLFLTRPSLQHYYPDSAAIQQYGPRFLTLLEQGAITLPAPKTLALSDVAQAHELLKQRQVTQPLRVDCQA